MTDNKNNEIIFSDGSDLGALQELETEEIILETGGKKFRYVMSSLVPADLVEVRKRIARKQVDKDEQELFLAYLALRKNHPKLRWNSFRAVNTKWHLKFIAVMYTMNGMNEVFRAINPAGSAGQPQQQQPDAADDFTDPIDFDDNTDATDPDEL